MSKSMSKSKERPIQYFSQEYLARCAGISPDEIIDFLENYRNLFAEFAELPEKCHLISLKVEPSLLNAFKQKAQLEGVAYQTLIKKLMRDWLQKK